MFTVNEGWFGDWCSEGGEDQHVYLLLNDCNKRLYYMLYIIW